MGMKYLGAATATAAYMPQYINFSQDGDEVCMTARSSIPEGSKEIVTRIPAALFARMLDDLNKNFGPSAKAAAPEEPTDNRFRPSYIKKKNK